MKDKPELTEPERWEKNYDAARSLAKRRPWLFTVFLSVGIIVLAGFVLKFLGMISKVEDLNKDLTQERLKVAALQAELAPFRTFALAKFGGDDTNALAKLAQELGGLKNQMLRDRQTIQDLQVIVTARFKGNWKPGLERESVVSYKGNGGFLTLTSKTNGKAQPIPLHTREFMVYPEDNGVWTSHYTSTLTKGAFPSGELVESLRAYDLFEFTYPGISKNKLVDGPLLFADVTFGFIINGKPLSQLTITPTEQLVEKDTLRILSETNVFELLAAKLTADK